MNHIPRPIVITAFALIAITVAVYITSSVIAEVSAGVELSARGIGAPAVLWILAILLGALAVVRWTQRRRYVRTTTPVERAAARTRTPPPAHRPGDDLDYGTRIEDAP